MRARICFLAAGRKFRGGKDCPGVVSNVVRMSETPDSVAQRRQFNQNVLKSMLDSFIAPELKKRDLDTDPTSIDRFLVEIQPGQPDAIVRLGEEAYLDVICDRNEIGTHIVGIRPQEQAIHPDSGWVCYLRVEEGFVLHFDFRRYKPRAQGLLVKAQQFLDVAISSEAHLSVALDNLHSAAELTVQALMLLEGNTTQSHQERRAWLKQWTDHENSPKEHADLVADLASKRKTVRYGAETPRLKPGRFKKMCALVQQMIDSSEARFGANSPTARYTLAEDLDPAEID